MAGVKGQVQRRGVERRSQIVDTAIDLFARQGFRGTGIAAIAEAVGITPGAILHHFGSKEGLLEAVIEERDARTSARLVNLAATGGRDGLRNMIRVAEEVEADRKLAVLYTVLLVENLEPEHSAHDFFVQRGQLVRQMMIAILRLGIRRKEFRSDIDIDLIASEALGFMEGAQVVWLLDPEKSSLVAMYRSYFTRLSESLSAGLGPVRKPSIASN